MDEWPLWAWILLVVYVPVGLIAAPLIWWHRRRAATRGGRIARALVLGPLVLLGAFLLVASVAQRSTWFVAAAWLAFVAAALIRRRPI